MTDEFARRLGEAENKLRATAQDRDAVKRELNQVLKEVQAKAALEAIVKEKEDLVQVSVFARACVVLDVRQFTLCALCLTVYARVVCHFM